MLVERRLKRDLEALQTDFNKLLKEVKGMGNHGRQEASEYTAMAAEQIEDLMHKAEASMEKLRDQMKEAGKRVETTIEEHPIMSVVAALGVGFILGKLISLSKD